MLVKVQGAPESYFFTFRHDFATKYVTATQALIGRIFMLLEIWTIYVVQSLELSREYFEFRINTTIFGQLQGATENHFFYI